MIHFYNNLRTIRHLYILGSSNNDTGNWNTFIHNIFQFYFVSFRNLSVQISMSI